MSQDTVYNAKRELQKNGKLTELGELNTDEKREQVREFVEKSVHIIGSNTLNIPSEREQKRDAVRSYTEDTQADIAADLGGSEYLVSNSVS